jgi:gluconate 2-dehydrogenase alpha chain
MTEPRPVDVVVVGLGAAGGLAAAHLALAGLSVCGLDAGGRYEAGQFTVDELANDRRHRLVGAKVAAEVPTVRADRRQTATPATVRQLMMNGVGGSKIHSGCGSVRLMPWHFTQRSSTVERYGAAALPAGGSLVDWPYGYAELEPYYDRVERMFGVAGEAGNLGGEIQPGGNPFEAPRSRPYPMPPLRRTGWTRLMDATARELGWHPFAPPAAVNSVPYGGRPACTYCGNCTHNGCWTDAKGLVSLEGLPAAEASGNLRVVTGARVTEILTDAAGRASGVAYVSGGRRYEQRAAVVLLASFVYEVVRLLLLSRLGNGTGQVGRHFSAHALRMAWGEFGGRELNTWSGATGQATAVDDFNADNFDHTGLGFIGGGRLAAGMEKKLLMAARQPPPGVGRWGAGYKRWLAEGLRSMATVAITVEELPHRDAYLDLDPRHVDAAGYPVVRVTRDWIDNDRRLAAYLRRRAEQWLRAAGATRVWHSPDVVQNVVAHAYGGTRMGVDPAGSVVDPWGFCHDVTNLGILGPSTFPSSSGLAPVLTIEATALRTAEHLLRNWSAIA